MSASEFDDFLGLRGRNFSRHRVVAFVGCSGSGKSTAIRFLIEHHPDFREPGTIVVDEALTRSHIRDHRTAIRNGARILMASHLHPWKIRSALPLVGVAIFRTDADPAKLARRLERSGVTASRNAIRSYVRTFGASYTDLDIILERFPGRSLDDALARFHRFCKTECRSPAAD